MEAFFTAKIAELCKTSKNYHMMGWNDWRKPVDELIIVGESINVDSDELKKARDAAVSAMDHLRRTTDLMVVKVEQQKVKIEFTVRPAGT